MMQRKRIGDILLEETSLSEEQLNEGLSLHREKGVPLGEMLIKQGFIREEDLLKALSIQLGIPYTREFNGGENLSALLLSKIPISFFKRHRLFPIQKSERGVKVAVRDPLDLQPCDDLSLFLNSPIELVLS
ncbi:MAG: hypothetical protein HY731_00735, partial [Candidatus Tectomicrobia bacterium]|nr:hypothetical protein [Candidatus Tectomicrobia bacterium]